jgi:membrane-associated protease RseP (regulator of RpoE activity)
MFKQLALTLLLFSGVCAEAQEAQKPFLGIGFSESQSPAGIIVNYTVDGGPARAAGLQPNDVIVKISGKPVSFASFHSHLAEFKPGERLDMEIVRNGQVYKANAVLVVRTTKLEIAALMSEKQQLDIRIKQAELQGKLAKKLADEYEAKLNAELKKENPISLGTLTAAYVQFSNKARALDQSKSALKNRLSEVEESLLALQNR